MVNPRRIEMDSKPNKIELLGNGTYYYNYDVQSEIISEPDMETGEIKEKTRWNYIQVHLRGTPEYKKCVEAVIRTYLDINEEFDLINSMNKYNLGLSTDEEDKIKYQEYLNLVENIKKYIKNDFKCQE